MKQVEGLEAVAITTPPSPRYEIVRECIARGLHVLMEKPPTVTLSETDELARLAEAKGVTLFATWHARHNPAVATAARLLAGKRISEMRILWHEDVHKWHPGQQWIWEPGASACSIPASTPSRSRRRFSPARCLFGQPS
ncbi:Gfo/Idh/MocA family oxidoreductase [Sphingomonas sediminicola]|uniref:Gfo/Idh/MocA family oxidoreductase n=1 Tax=Sphingomonas sediminicola TaxID=386874 RepID=A0ABX6TA41_9SPHN|nr:Gfo/Idh/MocA family oxidoreductase [Sphingomonas sediminicola]